MTGHHPNRDDLARLLAESDIRALITRAALIGDTGALEDYASIYSTLAVWRSNTNDVGLPAIIESTRDRRAANSSGPGTNTKHLVSVMAIDFDDADTAHAVSYFVFLTETTMTPHIAVAGTYADRLARIDGEWRITERVITAG